VREMSRRAPCSTVLRSHPANPHTRRFCEPGRRISLRAARRLALGARGHCFPSRATRLPLREPLLRLEASCPVRDARAASNEWSTSSGRGTACPRRRTYFPAWKHVAARPMKCFPQSEAARTSARAALPPTGRTSFVGGSAGAHVVACLSVGGSRSSNGWKQCCFRPWGAHAWTRAALLLTDGTSYVNGSSAPSGIARLSDAGSRSSLGRSSGASE
jgi:hypothetical protein